MKNPVLVIMAAGMGSRYGGMKQMDPIDDEGHLIIDFSLYDALRCLNSLLNVFDRIILVNMYKLVV